MPMMLNLSISPNEAKIIKQAFALSSPQIACNKKRINELLDSMILDAEKADKFDKTKPRFYLADFGNTLKQTAWGKRTVNLFYVKQSARRKFTVAALCDFGMVAYFAESMNELQKYISDHDVRMKSYKVDGYKNRRWITTTVSEVGITAKKKMMFIKIRDDTPFPSRA